MDPALKPYVNCLQRSVIPAQRVEKRPVEHHTPTPIAVADNKAGDKSSYSIFPLVNSGVIALSDSEKAEALADNLEAQFLPVADPSAPAVIDTVDVALSSYFLSPAGERHLTTSDEVHEAMTGLKVSKAPGPKSITNRALRHLPRRAVSLPARILNAVLHTHHFLPNVEACSIDIYPYFGEGSSTARFLSTY